MTSKCTSCGGDIVWIKDQDGTRLPVNKTRVRVYEGSGLYVALDEARKPSLFRISHFLTCPNATGHSKAKVQP